MHSLTFEAIGTQWVIDSENELSDQLKDKIHLEIERFDNLYSRFRQKSLVSQMAEKAGKYTISREDISLFFLYKQLYDATGGLFTPLIGQLLSDAGYDSSYSLQSRSLYPPPQWDDCIELGKTYIQIKKPVLLDLGGIGKGFLIDSVSKIIQSHEIVQYCIDAGGDIISYSADKQSLQVGLEHPENPQQVIGVASITNQSICASAGNRRKWGEFHHIMNPHTQKAENTVLATWVIADTAAVADALATCLFFTSPDKLLDRFTFKYVIVYPDFSVAKSSDFPVEFYYR